MFLFIFYIPYGTPADNILFQVQALCTIGILCSVALC